MFLETSSRAAQELGGGQETFMAIGTAGWEIGPVTALLRYAESDRRAKRHGEISPLDCRLITRRLNELPRRLGPKVPPRRSNMWLAALFCWQCLGKVPLRSVCQGMELDEVNLKLGHAPPRPPPQAPRNSRPGAKTAKTTAS
ncbi:hypothetical protein CTAM01_08078 [Colletotrichum tamarilloi]|uniref:Uncharacterized protein n=1 Tax=Colletotrichum tamarilloi TaxID=1209934 RepID=A0ABQ9R765_9PEZI|nr:uncharacterized protein CTAM01_08078 [Colletotrichum tamarilloi]KAK1497066.1 hypothetical protein CTAM01_08078 [Colletotrichum tamarilloi]